ncbi:MAG: hypothetical protein J6A52_07560 [Bacilli bacterium]|nr:hypothetical protein [Bacilli bacterium]
MNKKLPKIYHCDDSNLSTNKCSYYSYQDSRNILSTSEKIVDDNFFNYFDRDVNIVLVDGTTINNRILSKLNNKVLLANGTYLNVDEIKEIS